MKVVSKSLHTRKTHYVLNTAMSAVVAHRGLRAPHPCAQCAQIRLQRRLK